MHKSIIALSLLALVSFGCRQTFISGVLYPQHAVRVGETFELSIMLLSPSGDEVLRWIPINGKCETNKDEHSLSCQYLAEQPGQDNITVEVRRSGQVIAKTSFTINVEKSDSAGGPTVQLGGGRDNDAEDLGSARIKLTETPPFGKGGDDIITNVSGTVSGIPRLARFNIIIYAHAENGVWWVQPFETSPFADVQSDGSWTTKTHLGTQYEFLLMPSSYTNPPPKNYAPTRLPDVIVSLLLSPSLPNTNQEQHLSK